MQPDDCFLVVRDDAGSRRFKTRFRSVSEFFAVSVAKLRRAISAAVPSSLSDAAATTSADPTSFSLSFTDEESGQSIVLPEGPLAEHALVSDWGIRPGDTVSLSWRRSQSMSPLRQQKREQPQQSQHTMTITTRHQTLAQVYQGVETIPTPQPKLQQQQQQRRYYDPAPLFVPTKDTQDDVVDAAALLLQNNSNDDGSDGLTAEQRELQLKWLREAGLAPPPAAPTAPVSSTRPPPKAPAVTFQHQERSKSQQVQQAQHTQPHAVRHQHHHRKAASSSSEPDPHPPMPSLFASPQTQVSPQRATISLESECEGLEYKTFNSNNSRKDDLDYDDLEYDTHNDHNGNENSNHDADEDEEQGDPEIRDAIRCADRKENIRLRSDIANLAAECDTWKERAQTAFESLEQKLELRVIGSPESRRALANALVEIETLKKRLEKQSKQLETTKSSLDAERRVRRSMQRELETLRGHVRVIVRVRRGDNSNSSTNGEPPALQLHNDGSTITVNRGLLKPRGEFEFFKVLGPNCTQEDLFTEQIAPLIDGAVQSRTSLSLLACGSTSSGKSTSVFGFAQQHQKTVASNKVTADTGIALRTAKMLLELVHPLNKDGNGHGARFDIGVSVVELYCDELRDLLVLNAAKEQQQSQNTTGNGGKAQSSNGNSSICVFRTESEAAELIRCGAERRFTEATLCNASSSRSHCIMTFSVLCGGNVEFKIVLVDLAGCERLNRSGSSGQRLVEAQFINKSLAALGDVVHALTTNNASHHPATSTASSKTRISSTLHAKPFVPYRNSSLTMLLQDVMSGNATTIFLACVVDDAAQAEESYSTLSFASRVRCVKNVQFARGEISRGGVATEAPPAQHHHHAQLQLQPRVRSPSVSFVSNNNNTAGVATPRSSSASKPRRVALGGVEANVKQQQPSQHAQPHQEQQQQQRESSSSAPAAALIKKVPRERKPLFDASGVTENEQIPVARVALVSRDEYQNNKQVDSNQHSAGFASAGEAARLRLLLLRRKSPKGF